MDDRVTEEPQWTYPRHVSVVVDNDSWVLPYAEQLVDQLRQGGDNAVLCRQYDDIQDGVVAFYFGCVRITPPDVLARNRFNLVVHASDLPKGRGFSPMTWLTLEGETAIPVCLITAAESVDSGEVVYRDQITFEGHELLAEMQAAMGRKHVELALRFMQGKTPAKGEPQSGEATFYSRRSPADSRLDPDRTIAEQFNLLRTVDNEKYPAFFELRGHTYKITISKVPQKGEDS